MKKEHTPGPWKAVKFFPSPNVVIGDDGIPWVHQDATIFGLGEVLIGYVNLSTSRNGGYPGVENLNVFDANIALVQAAPKMLAALKKAEAYLQGIRTGADFEEADLVAVIQKVIAEAVPES